MSTEDRELELHRVRQICGEHGLTIVEVRRRGVLLELVPADLAQVPDPEALRQIAEALGGDGIRHVALALEERSRGDGHADTEES